MIKVSTSKIDVLNTGFVRLVSCMQPVIPGDVGRAGTGTDPDPDENLEVVRVPKPKWTGDLEVIRNARVSYDADWRDTTDSSANDKQDSKLIKYLQSNQHTSPFEAMVFTFEIKCPLFIARQWHRHRTWSYNEVSARYTEVPNDMFVPAKETISSQHSSNKQMRTDITHPNADTLHAVIEAANVQSFEHYETLLAMGCPRELARGVLPQNTYTRFFGTVDLHNLLHFLRLRLHEHAQYEIRAYAEALVLLTKQIVPVTMEHFLAGQKI